MYQRGVATLVSIAVGLQRDQAAVAAVLQEPWSQGQTEGQVNRLKVLKKVLKRQMYGRAKPYLLRCRLFYQPSR